MKTIVVPFKKYKISTSWKIRHAWYIEANSLEEAIRIAEDGEFPCDSLNGVGEYVEKSFQVDKRKCEET